MSLAYNKPFAKVLEDKISTFEEHIKNIGNELTKCRANLKEYESIIQKKDEDINVMQELIDNSEREKEDYKKKFKELRKLISEQQEIIRRCMPDFGDNCKEPENNVNK